MKNPPKKLIQIKKGLNIIKKKKKLIHRYFLKKIFSNKKEN